MFYWRFIFFFVFFSVFVLMITQRWKGWRKWQIKVQLCVILNVNLNVNQTTYDHHIWIQSPISWRRPQPQMPNGSNRNDVVRHQREAAIINSICCNAISECKNYMHYSIVQYRTDPLRRGRDHYSIHNITLHITYLLKSNQKNHFTILPIVVLVDRRPTALFDLIPIRLVHARN